MIFIIIINIILLKINIVSSWWSQSQIRSVMNGKCLDIGGGKNVEGANVQMWDCHNDWQQSWYYDLLTKEIKNMNPIGIEYCLDVDNGNIFAENFNIRIWECDGSNAQKWESNNDFTITNSIDGKCLDIYKLDDNNGANVKLYTCNGGINQLWRLISEIKSVLNGKCLTVQGGIQSSGKNIEMYECDKAYGQKWYYDKNTKQIANYYLNGVDLCLEVDPNTVGGTNNIILSTCSSSIEQKWTLNEDETITNDINGLCLTIDGYNYHNHANVVLSHCNPELYTQRWFGTFIPMKSPQELIVRETYGTAFDWVWNDVGSGSTLPGSYWKPKIYSTEAFISFVNVVEYYAPNEKTMIIMRYPLDALANPIDYDLIWDDGGSLGTYSVWVWRPIPPPGYICYGDYVRAHISDKPTSADGYKCIHSRYVHLDSERIATSQELMWNDDESGAGDDIQIVKLRTNHHWPKQYYRSHDKYNRYIDNAYGAIELTVIPPTPAVQMKTVFNSLCMQQNGGNALLLLRTCEAENEFWPSSFRDQHWHYKPETRSLIEGNGACLTVNGDNINGQQVRAQRCNGNDNQQWLMDANGAIIQLNDNMCLDIHYNGHTPIIWECNGKVSQSWVGGNSFGIQNVESFAAKRFAPILKFDQAASDYGYPMNPQTYVDNNCINSFDLAKCEQRHLNIVSNPTYYRILSGYDVHTGTFNIMYWWFYGYQHACNPTAVFSSGAHEADWERVIVHIKHWLIDEVTFYQHDGHYTLSEDDINNDGDHVFVYVGKIGHGSYYVSRSGVGGGCGYFYDFRNPDHSSIINTWNNLINLETSTDAWIVTTGKNKPDFDTGSDPRDDKDNENDCDSCGCNWGNCNSDVELMVNPVQCVRKEDCRKI